MSKDFNDGTWTRARFHAFLKGGLRQLSQRWPPKYRVLKAARLERGVYECVGYGRGAHKVRWKDKVYVDHIDPVVDAQGFQSWDDVIERMFVDSDKLQVLCKTCHDAKSKDERQERKKKV